MASTNDSKVFYPSADGRHTLVGILTSPAKPQDQSAAQPSNGKNVVVLVHGAMANKNSFYHKYFAETLSTDLGFHVFRFDFTGNGESGPIFKKTDDGKDSDEQYRNMMESFWCDVSDLAKTCEYLNEKHGLTTACIIGHSRGGQVAHMFAVQHASRLKIPRIIGTNMRFYLEFWRTTYRKYVAEEGRWTLQWKNRGAPIKHIVSDADVNLYAEVPMHDVSKLGVKVLNCYGLIAPNGTGQASYDTGNEFLTDGVVPFTDVEAPANLIKDHTLRFIENVGHFFREDGSAERLWVVVRNWLIDKPDSDIAKL